VWSKILWFSGVTWSLKNAKQAAMSTCYLSRKRNHFRWSWTRLLANSRWLASLHKSLLAPYTKLRSGFQTAKTGVFMLRLCVLYHIPVKTLRFRPGRRTGLNQVRLRLANQTWRWTTYLNHRQTKLNRRLCQSVQWSTNKRSYCSKTWDSQRMSPKKLCSSCRVEVCPRLWNG
jgi:hypothetical protein